MKIAIKRERERKEIAGHKEWEKSNKNQEKPKNEHEKWMDEWMVRWCGRDEAIKQKRTTEYFEARHRSRSPLLPPPPPSDSDPLEMLKAFSFDWYFLDLSFTVKEDGVRERLMVFVYHLDFLMYCLSCSDLFSAYKLCALVKHHAAVMEIPFTLAFTIIYMDVWPVAGRTELWHACGIFSDTGFPEKLDLA